MAVEGLTEHCAGEHVKRCEQGGGCRGACRMRQRQVRPWRIWLRLLPPRTSACMLTMVGASKRFVVRVHRERGPTMPGVGRKRSHDTSPTGRSQRDINRRALSQNFLRAAGARLYLSKLDIDPETLVLEVGAGDGVITDLVAPSCREVWAYEIDVYHARKLEDRVRHHRNVRVIADNFLAERPPAQEFAVIGNVPFSITSNVVDWCLASRTLTSASIITQWEYARKRTGDFGRWSLRTVETWAWFSWELLGRIPRDEFRPLPRVDGGVLRIAQRRRPLIASHRRTAYLDMVALGFAGVGGSLYKSLSQRHPSNRVATALFEAGVDRATVVAYVTPDEWIMIFRSLDRR